MSSKYDSFRSILDQLMGGDRDLLPDQKTNRQMHFSDDKVCKFYICGLCPHDLFTNTKSDLGPCPNLHDDEIKEQYDKCGEKWKYPYERDFIARMQKMVSDLDKRIERGHQRLSLQDSDNPLSSDKMEKLDAISEQIELLLRQMEELGALGRVQEAQALELQILKLKAEQEAVKKGVTGPGQQQEKRLKVCEVCGAFLVVGDTEDRIKSHNDGKQHQGYDAIRTILDEKRKNIRELTEDRSKIIIRDDRFRERDQRRDASRRDSRRDNRDRDRDYDRERDYRDRDYRSSRDTRDRDRDRDYRDRDRDRRDRYRDRDRDRDRDSRRRRERSMEKEDEEGGSSKKRERERDREPQEVLDLNNPTTTTDKDADDSERKRRRADE